MSELDEVQQTLKKVKTQMSDADSLIKQLISNNSIERLNDELSSVDKVKLYSALSYTIHTLYQTYLALQNQPLKKFQSRNWKNQKLYFES